VKEITVFVKSEKNFNSLNKCKEITKIGLLIKALISVLKMFIS